MTMRAAVVHGAEDLRIDEVEIPVLDASSVLVRVAFGGICGSDQHYYHHGRNGIYEITTPLIIGHEIVGTIAAVGDDVDPAMTVDSPVAIHPARPTPKAGETVTLGLHLVPGGSYLGSASTTPHTHGGFAEYVRVDADQIRRLPDALPLRRAVLAEPLAVALHGVARAGDVTGKTVLVTGAGPIGCLTIAALRAAGASEIITTDLSAEPLDIARRVGAAKTIQIGSGPPLDEESVDVVIEASGSPRATAGALHAVRRGGIIVQLGMLPAGDLPIPLAALVSREITLTGSQRFELELDQAIELLAVTPDLEAVIGPQFPLHDAEAAIIAAGSPSVAGKVIIAAS